MSLWARIKMVFKSKANKAVSSLENPTELLDLSYEQLLEESGKVNQALADIATAKHTLNLRIQDLTKEQTRYELGAKGTANRGDTESARELVTQSVSLGRQIGELDEQKQLIAGKEADTKEAAVALRQRIETFATRKESLKAAYTAGKAQTNVAEVLAGLGNNNAGATLERAESKIKEVEARGAATRELLDSGALPDFSKGSKNPALAAAEAYAIDDEIERKLAELTGPAPIER